jgi:hypothetical protein
VVALDRRTTLFFGEFRLPFSGDEETLSLFMGEPIADTAAIISFTTLNYYALHNMLLFITEASSC